MPSAAKSNARAILTLAERRLVECESYFTTSWTRFVELVTWQGL